MQIIINNILFEFQVQNEIKPYFEKRVIFSKYNNYKFYKKIDVIVELDNQISLFDIDFQERSEPKFLPNGFIREIPNIGNFIFNRDSNTIMVKYSNISKHNFDVLEVVVDFTMQAIDLSTVFYNTIPLHAAVVHKHGYGVIIMGASTSGKTTTETLLIHHGFEYFSDDVLFLSQNCLLYNNQECILPMREPTVSLLNNFFGEDIIFNPLDGEKHIERYTHLSLPKNIIPAVILLPGKTKTQNKSEKPYIIQKVNSSELYISLLKESISPDFPPDIIKLYMKYLKILSESTTGYKVLRTHNYTNIYCVDLVRDLEKIINYHL